jgi:hypothetical protein
MPHCSNYQAFNSRMRGHMLVWHAQDAFKCKKPGCSTYFATKAAAAEHFQASHIVEGHLKYPFLFCANCKFQTRWKHNLEMHIEAMHFPKTMKCPECPKMFASKDHIHEHARKSHSTSRKKCPHCGMTPVTYKVHVANSKCMKCFEPFKCFTLMRKHSKLCKLSYDCDFCDETFKNEFLLMRHFHFKHKKETKACGWVGRNTKNRHLSASPAKFIFLTRVSTIPISHLITRFTCSLTFDKLDFHMMRFR